MSQSWQRLREGTNIQEHDITLLKHELLEIEYMYDGNEQTMSYDEAHKKINEKYNYLIELENWKRKGGLRHVDKNKKVNNRFELFEYTGERNDGETSLLRVWKENNEYDFEVLKLCQWDKDNDTDTLARKSLPFIIEMIDGEVVEDERFIAFG